MFGLCFANAFGQENPQWRLPVGAKARIGKGGVKEIRYFPDGTQLAVASTIGVWVYDVHTGEPIDLLIGHTGPVNSIVFSPNGGTFATGSDDNTIRLWDANTREHKTSFVGHADDVNSVAFSRTVKYLQAAVTITRCVYGICRQGCRFPALRHTRAVARSVSIFSGNLVITRKCGILSVS